MLICYSPHMAPADVDVSHPLLAAQHHAAAMPACPPDRLCLQALGFACGAVYLLSPSLCAVAQSWRSHTKGIFRLNILADTQAEHSATLDCQVDRLAPVTSSEVECSTPMLRCCCTPGQASAEAACTLKPPFALILGPREASWEIIGTTISAALCQDRDCARQLASAQHLARQHTDILGIMTVPLCLVIRLV